MSVAAARPTTARKAEATGAPAVKTKARLWWRVLRIFLILAGLGAAAGATGLVYLYYNYASDLPVIDTVDSYRPPISTKVYAVDGRLIGEFATERRDVVAYEKAPAKLVQAFVAAEDQEFFLHGGIDPRGIIRAFFKNVKAGRKVAGGSTITQQVAKSFVGREKTYTRKIREALLAIRLESKFSKRDILYLYLNQIYLGHGLYGVQAASKGYFRKNVWELTLPEMAILAGLPQAPSRYSPVLNPDKANERRLYVLQRMEEDGYITPEERAKAGKVEVVLNDIEDYYREKAPYYTEHVRRYIYDKYGEDALYRGGLQIYTAVDLDRQYAAEDAVIRGVREIDKRQGYRGPLASAGRDEWDGWKKRLAAQTARDGGVMQPGQIYVGLVTAVSKDGKTAEVHVGQDKKKLPVAAMRWAHKDDPTKVWARIESMAKVLAPGDLIQVRLAAKRDLTHVYEPGSLMPAGDPPMDGVTVALEQDPSVQGALISMIPQTGYVSAMIGGYSFDVSEFNRAFQACRQPGSAFKPLIYAAAIDKLDYNPSTIVVDSPVVFDDFRNDFRWKPQNFDPDFKGETTVRNAVVSSLNLPAIKTLIAVGVYTAIEYAKKLGIRSPLDPNLSLALGGSCVNLWELTDVYANLSRMGTRTAPIFIRKVVDRDGEVLEMNADPADPFLNLKERVEQGVKFCSETGLRVLDEDSAFILVHLLHEVCTSGTAGAAAKLGIPVAGKTGTTNDSFDAWFEGFSRHLVTGVWVGFDTYEKPLGRWETGGKAALPIWMAYMSKALKGVAETWYPTPPGIVFRTVDRKNGQPVPPGSEGAISEPFKIRSLEKMKIDESKTQDFMKIDSGM